MQLHGTEMLTVLGAKLQEPLNRQYEHVLAQFIPPKPSLHPEHVDDAKL
jgi:hypothetical protein